MSKTCDAFIIIERDIQYESKISFKMLIINFVYPHSNGTFENEPFNVLRKHMLQKKKPLKDNPFLACYIHIGNMISSYFIAIECMRIEMCVLNCTINNAIRICFRRGRNTSPRNCYVSTTVLVLLFSCIQFMLFYQTPDLKMDFDVRLLFVIHIVY